MDNNKNQRLVNYLSAILLILIVVIVSYTLYTQQSKQEPIISTTTTTKPLGFFAPGREIFFSKEDLISILKQFGLEIPESLSENSDNVYALLDMPEAQTELNRFFEILLMTIIEQQKQDELHPVKELAMIQRIIVTPNNNDEVSIILDDLSSPKQLQEGDLAVFGIDLEDILANKDIVFSKEDVLYICSTIQPPLLRGKDINFTPQLLDTYYSFSFQEGIVSCSDGLNMEYGHLVWWLGILNNDSYKVKIYLVDENTRSEIQKSSSFSEAEEILNNYQLIYEKNINVSEQI